MSHYYGESKERQLLFEKKQVDRLNTKIALSCGAPAPINRLSIDILTYIFELHCRDPPTLSLGNGVWNLTSPQITLSHVCLEWRAIMLSARIFWKNIKIMYGKPDTPQILGSVVKTANELLSRAKGLPCSVEVGPIGGVHNLLDEDKNWHNIIVRDLILLHKVNKLHITFTYQQLRDLLELPDDRLSCIEDLWIEYFDPDLKAWTDVTYALPLGMQRLSNLRSFSIFSTPTSSYHKFYDIPWHNLRHIQLNVMTRRSFCLDILGRSAAVLETCSLLLTDHDDLKSLLQVPVHLSRLRNLEVLTTGWVEKLEEEALKWFLSTFRFPNLKSLKLGSLNTSGITLDLEMLLEAQHASKMHLEELCFTESTLGVDVRTILLAFPSLLCLELPKKVMFTNDTITEVGTGSLGAFLQHLTIKDPDLDLGKLLQMVKAHSCTGNQDNKHGSNAVGFRSVTLRSDKVEEEVATEVLDMIKQIRLIGVDLNVVFPMW